MHYVVSPRRYVVSAMHYALWVWYEGMRFSIYSMYYPLCANRYTLTAMRYALAHALARLSRQYTACLQLRWLFEMLVLAVQCADVSIKT